ncbi:hypothetical protein BATDEDRAFT_90838 [Batrachochytrium dendrobatidis JAM81]|uniref:Uncharacterized protein n=2 Tax=Batrachochytrium dendrobatidis TaxID=109871 RepID=F4P8P7_BATDJ|nr:uncharacterized protein BATDEDRAFT_90838 [Batrachochytrium dendrobatidis JAM81]EGF78181.1 hypothetical protein BATDEDRAFT_90838 [Batrachochytrium dendrobatidis JAM81]OAJ44483.1 hypothetical protein BDEG_27705 [Batrachochytrium dendrobatidis JEL423]|eukprot:XP_006681226.1 hypothetical protein BATDEDRAFT_90838 [Batrachochytrium dendrobatidis JAM81]
MRLVDILFVLTAATTANAILIPTDPDGSPKASVTSSQAFGPTDKPSPEIPDEDWQEIIGIISSKIYRHGQHQPIDVVDPSTSKRGRKRPADQPSPNTPKRSRKRPMDQPSPSTPKRGRKRPIDVVDPSTPKRGRKRPADQPSPNTSSQDQQQPMDQPIPSTSRQDQQQPINESESANTVPNQVTVLSQRYQRTFNRIKQRFELSKEIQKKKRKEYYKYADLKFSQQLALAMGKEISEPMHNPEVEKRLKEKYVVARRKLSSAKKQLKNYMAKHGLESQEPKVDSD